MKNKERLNKLPKNQQIERVVLKVSEIARVYGANRAYDKFYEWYNQEVEARNMKGEDNNG